MMRVTTTMTTRERDAGVGRGDRVVGDRGVGFLFEKV
jgi:hypothetical protein